jgi:hypothetical protein
MGFGIWIGCKANTVHDGAQDMTKTEFVRILSRLFALYLLAWALTECTYLPRYIHSLVHYLNHPIHVDTDYSKDYYLLESASLVLRIAGLSLAVLYFWNAGPTVMRLFTPKELEAEDSQGQIESLALSEFGRDSFCSTMSLPASSAAEAWESGGSGRGAG